MLPVWADRQGETKVADSEQKKQKKGGEGKNANRRVNKLIQKNLSELYFNDTMSFSLSVLFRAKHETRRVSSRATPKRA